jgi:hypothetical protein
MRKIVRTRRMNVYAAKPRRNGGQISRRTERERSRIPASVRGRGAGVKRQRREGSEWPAGKPVR